MCALINVFLIVLMVQSGLAYLRPIRCFICDSTTNPNCTNLRGLSDSYRNLLDEKMMHEPLYEECSYEKVNSSATTRRPHHEQKNSWSPDLSDTNYKLPHHEQKKTWSFDLSEGNNYYNPPHHEQKKILSFDEANNYRPPPHHEQKKSWLFDLSEATNYRPPNEIEIPMVCQTIIGRTDDKVTTTVRRCQYKNIDSCEILKQKLRRHTVDGKIYHCSVCEGNGCNGSSCNNGFGMLIGVLTTITTLFCHFIYSIE